MTIAQRQQALDRAARLPLPPSRDEVMRASFHIVEGVEERRGTRFAKAELQLRFPERTDSALALVRKLESTAPAAPRPQAQ